MEAFSAIPLAFTLLRTWFDFQGALTERRLLTNELENAFNTLENAKRTLNSRSRGISRDDWVWIKDTLRRSEMMLKDVREAIGKLQPETGRRERLRSRFGWVFKLKDPAAMLASIVSAQQSTLTGINVLLTSLRPSRLSLTGR